MTMPTVPRRDTMLTVAFEATESLLCMLQLDEPTLYYGEYVVRGPYTTRGKALVCASYRAARLMLDDLRERSSADGGFDQPLSWYRVARVHAERLRAALGAVERDRSCGIITLVA